MLSHDHPPPKDLANFDRISSKTVIDVAYHMLGASVPLISRKSYLSSKKKSLKTSAIVSPGSERIDHVQSRLLSYSAGYPGLVIDPAVPLNVPPHAPSAGKIQTRRRSEGGGKKKNQLAVHSTIKCFVICIQHENTLITTQNYSGILADPIWVSNPLACDLMYRSFHSHDPQQSGNKKTEWNEEPPTSTKR